jgi:F0F1-type ATP synthase delta subunit
MAEQQDLTQEGVAEAIKAVEHVLDVLGQVYEAKAEKRVADIIIAQELSLKELKALQK